MGMSEQHLQYAAGIGAQIERILVRHGIRTTYRHVDCGEGRGSTCWEARHGNGDVVLEWSIGHDGAAGAADYLTILLRIDRPEDPDQTLQQFKLLLVLSTRTWHSSTAGQLGFALDTQPDLGEELVMATVDKMARWFCDPQHRMPALPAARDE